MWPMHNLPITRNYRNGEPLNEHFRRINKSEQIRRIFHNRGNVDNGVVHDTLIQIGGRSLDCSDSLISAQRKKLQEAGLMAS